MALPYKPGPQAHYLVNKMAESEKTLIDAVNRLSEKLDGYDKRFSSIGLDISKVQSQVDLAMRSIQVLQKEQVLLIKSVESVGGSSTSAHTTSGVIGPAPTSSSTVPAHPLIKRLSLSFPVGSCFTGGRDSDHRRPWMLKMDFPVFDGSDVRVWLDKCASYFHLYGIPPDFWVKAASLHMVGRASHWFQSYIHAAGSHTWEHFVIAVSQEFEVNTHHVKTMTLLNLLQSGSVEDYKNKFDQLVYNIRLYDNHMSETMLVSQFLLGLKEELRQVVELHLPETVSQAVTLASILEHVTTQTRPYHKRIVGQKSEVRSPFSGSDLWKARQLKELEELTTFVLSVVKNTRLLILALVVIPVQSI
jgi:hypothetical protein